MQIYISEAIWHSHFYLSQKRKKKKEKWDSGRYKRVGYFFSTWTVQLTILAMRGGSYFSISKMHRLINFFWQWLSNIRFFFFFFFEKRLSNILLSKSEWWNSLLKPPINIKAFFLLAKKHILVQNHNNQKRKKYIY